MIHVCNKLYQPSILVWSSFILTYDKSLFTICQITGSGTNSNDTVAITNKCIFDMIYSYAMLLSKKLDGCSKSSH